MPDRSLNTHNQRLPVPLRQPGNDSKALPTSRRRTSGESILMHQPQNAPETQQPPLAGVVERNIRSLLARRQRDEREKGMQQRVADAITAFTGSMYFIYFHLLIYGAWIVINLPVLPLPKFDPTYVILAMVASVEAIFLSTFVLMTQNRMSKQAEKRTELDLQISLLAEHEVTRLITLVKAIAEKLQVEASRDPELAELQRDVVPEKLIEAMERGGGWKS